jgi:hypothetical protein
VISKFSLYDFYNSLFYDFVSMLRENNRILIEGENSLGCFNFSLNFYLIKLTKVVRELVSTN